MTKRIDGGEDVAIGIVDGGGEISQGILHAGLAIEGVIIERRHRRKWVGHFHDIAHGVQRIGRGFIERVGGARQLVVGIVSETAPMAERIDAGQNIAGCVVNECGEVAKRVGNSGESIDGVIAVAGAVTQWINGGVTLLSAS